MTTAMRNSLRYLLAIASFLVVSHGICTWLPFDKLHFYLAYFFLPAFVVAELVDASFLFGAILSFVYIAALFLPTGLAFHLGSTGPRKRLFWLQVLVMIVHSVVSIVCYVWMTKGEP